MNKKQAIEVVASSNQDLAIVTHQGSASEAIAAQSEATWRQAGGGLPARESLAGLEEQLRNEVALFLKLEQKAAYTALRIGVLMLAARQDMPAEEYPAWLRCHLPMSRVTIWRFAVIAESYISKSGLRLDEAGKQFLTCAMLPGDTKPAPKAIQLAFDFVGKKSLTDLLDAIGKPRARQGGDHGGGAAYSQKAQRTDAEKKAEAKALVETAWQSHISGLRSLVCGEHQYIHLDADALSFGISTLKDCLKILMKEIQLRK